MLTLALRSSQEMGAHPISDRLVGTFRGFSNRLILVGGEPDGPMNRLRVVAFRASGSWAHNNHYSDKKKYLTRRTYATRISPVTETPKLSPEFIATLAKGDCIEFRKPNGKWSMSVTVVRVGIVPNHPNCNLVVVEYSSGRTKILSASQDLEAVVRYRAVELGVRP
jgi:hypothetical protein